MLPQCNLACRLYLLFSTRKMAPSRQHSCATTVVAHLLLLSAISDSICGARVTMRKPRADASRQVTSAAALERSAPPFWLRLLLSLAPGNCLRCHSLDGEKAGNQAGNSGKTLFLPSLRCSHFVLQICSRAWQAHVCLRTTVLDEHNMTAPDTVPSC